MPVAPVVLPIVMVLALAPVPMFMAPVVPDSRVRAVAAAVEIVPAWANVRLPVVSKVSLVVLLVLKARLLASLVPSVAVAPKLLPPCIKEAPTPVVAQVASWLVELRQRAVAVLATPKTDTRMAPTTSRASAGAMVPIPSRPIDELVGTVTVVPAAPVSVNGEVVVVW